MTFHIFTMEMVYCDMMSLGSMEDHGPGQQGVASGDDAIVVCHTAVRRRGRGRPRRTKDASGKHPIGGTELAGLAIPEEAAGTEESTVPFDRRAKR
jgi:hypothetical protein